MDDGRVLVEEDVMLGVREDVCASALANVRSYAARCGVRVDEVFLTVERSVAGAEVGCIDGDVFLVDDKCIAIRCLAT